MNNTPAASASVRCCFLPVFQSLQMVIPPVNRVIEADQIWASIQEDEERQNDIAKYAPREKENQQQWLSRCHKAFTEAMESES